MPNYTISIFKAWGARDAASRWVNSYEIQSTGLSPSAAELLTISGDLVAAERAFHLSSVQFLESRISTWAPDSHPYNPNAFTAVALSGTGARVAGTDDPLDINVSLFVKFAAATGRAGRRFYRGVLVEGDVAVSGNLRATPVGTSIANVVTALKTALTPYLSSGTSANGKLVMIGRYLVSKGPPPVYTDPDTRFVSDIVMGGVVINRHDHRFFNRAPTP